MQSNEFFMKKAEQEYLNPPKESKVFEKCHKCSRIIYFFEQGNGDCKISESYVLCGNCRNI